MPLTDVKIRNLSPREKLYRVADGRGLSLEVTPNGQKLWRYRYRFNDKAKMISLGAYPEVTLAKARDGVTVLRNMLTEGLNPAIERERRRREQMNVQANTFGQLAEELLQKKEAEGRAPRTLKKNRTLLAVLLPDLKDYPITQVDAQMLLATLTTAEKRGVRTMAHEARGLAGEIFRYAISTGRAKENPSASLKGSLFAPQGQGFSAITDLTGLRTLLRKIEAYEGDVLVRCGLLVLAHTFVRPGELREAKWVEIDLADAMWTIPAHRTKMKRDHLVPLTPQVIALFKEMSDNRASDEWVVGSRIKEGRPMSDMTFNKALKSMGYGGGVHHAHGFRKSASTILNEKNWNGDWVERQLAHVPGDQIRGTYNKAQYIDGRREMLTAWSEMLCEKA